MQGCGRIPKLNKGGDGHSNWSTEGRNGARCERSLDPKHVFVRDSLFQIHPWHDKENNIYYGDFLESNGKMLFTYGYLEISAKIPDGDGFWTAMWLRCRDFAGAARPEIDINECFGDGSCVHANLHTWPGDEAEAAGVVHTQLDRKKYPERQHICPDGKKFSEDFHTFGVLWTENLAWFTCDGVPYFKYTMGDKPTDKHCFGKKMWIVISEAVGFPAVKHIANSSKEVWENSSRFYVDWCYLYQIKDGKQQRVFMNK